jgi:1-acyl-sn-glycerol-3-phosphate acyltransferase
MRRTIHILKVVLILVAYGFLGPFGYLGFLLVSLLPKKDEVRWAKRFQAAIFRGFRLMHDWLRFLRIIHYQPRSFEGELPAGPCLLVANHPMLTDVTVVMSALRDVVTLVRETTFNVWWAKPLLRAAGQVSSPLSASGVVEMNREISKRFGQGFRVLVFPEGQRSFPDGTLREFSRAPFEAAFAAGVPVVPIVIGGSPAWLKKGQGFFEPLPVLPHFHLRILAPFDPKAFASSRELRTATRDLLESAQPAESPRGLPDSSAVEATQ